MPSSIENNIVSRRCLTTNFTHSSDSVYQQNHLRNGLLQQQQQQRFNSSSMDFEGEFLTLLLQLNQI